MNLGNKFIITQKLMITQTNIIRFAIFTISNFAIPLAFLFSMGNSLDIVLCPFICVTFLTFVHIILTFALIVYNAGILTPSRPYANTDHIESRSPVAKTCKLSFTNIFVEQVEIAVLYCRQCDVYLPLKGFHCDPCGVCYEDYKHHNYLLNNCITSHNLLLYFVYLVVGMLNYGLIFVALHRLSQVQNDLIIFAMLMISASCFCFTFAFYNFLKELHGIGVNKSMLTDAYAYKQQTGVFQKQYWANIKNFFLRRQARFMLKRREASTELTEDRES